MIKLPASSVAIESMFKERLLIAAAAAAMLFSLPAFAGVITDEFTFSTTGQSMWKEGSTSVFEREVSLIQQWGTFDDDSNGKAQKVTVGGITGSANDHIGVDVPNPDYAVWKTAYDLCRLVYSNNTCVNGRPAKKACIPVVGCHNVPGTKVDGLGEEPPKTVREGVVVDTRTGVKATLLTSGEAGIVPWIKASGGSIDAKLPVKTIVTLPDAITSGTPFTVTTQVSVKNSATITAKAPFLEAGVDGVVNMQNQFSIQGCFIGAGCSSDSDGGTLRAGSNGRFGMVGFDSITADEHPLRLAGKGKGSGGNPDFEDSISVPGVLFGTNYAIYYPAKGDVPSPRLGDITLFQLSDFVGGDVNGSGLELVTNQKVFDLNFSLTGAAEYSFNPPDPGVLSNTIVFRNVAPSYVPDPRLRYTLLDIGVGPRLGLQQEFDLTPDAWVKLEFDRPVTRQSDGMVFADGIVNVDLGTDIDLVFDGEVGNLVRRTFYMNDNQFSNVTGATVDPGMKIEIGCISLTGVLDYECAFIHDYATVGLLDMPIYDNKWTLGGFNQYSALGTDSSVEDRGVDFDPLPGGGGGRAVPTPATAALLAIGLFGLAFTRKRAVG